MVYQELSSSADHTCLLTSPLPLPPMPLQGHQQHCGHAGRCCGRGCHRLLAAMVGWGGACGRLVPSLCSSGCCLLRGQLCVPGGGKGRSSVWRRCSRLPIVAELLSVICCCFFISFLYFPLPCCALPMTEWVCFLSWLSANLIFCNLLVLLAQLIDPNHSLTACKRHAVQL